ELALLAWPNWPPLPGSPVSFLRVRSLMPGVCAGGRGSCGRCRSGDVPQGCGRGGAQLGGDDAAGLVLPRLREGVGPAFVVVPGLGCLAPAVAVGAGGVVLDVDDGLG